MICAFLSLLQVERPATHEVMLYDEGGPLAAHDKLLDDLARKDTLFGVEVGRWLIDEQDVGGNTEHEADGDSL